MGEYGRYSHRRPRSAAHEVSTSGVSFQLADATIYRKLEAYAAYFSNGAKLSAGPVKTLPVLAHERAAFRQQCVGAAVAQQAHL